MEIERKFLIRHMPDHLEQYPFHRISQAYLCTDPVIRIRREDDHCYLTVKGEGMLSREECNLPMANEVYEHLLTKAEGTVIEKTRYLIPLPDHLTLELDVFGGTWSGLIIAEVEFPDEEKARQFTPPDFLGTDVTFDPRYHNSWLSRHTPQQARDEN